MNLEEIRVLDGPNLFGLEPLVKVELSGVGEGFEREVAAVASTISGIHAALDLVAPEVRICELDQSGHRAIVFPWEHETLARGIAATAIEVVRDPDIELPLDRLKAAQERDIQDQNGPGWIRDAERTIPTVGITATNGKTTTTRILAHLARAAGLRAGWSSSSGVYIEGELVLEGDYTGPGGARRVLREADLDLAILETARGGMLLRGLAYESNDVGIFINVSADHLSLQGVETLETLAFVKSLVVRVTKPAGTVVLNADDPLVWKWRDQVRAKRVIATSQHPDAESVVDHLRACGEAVINRDGMITHVCSAEVIGPIARVDEIPATFGGAATFMVENVLAATAGAIALGLRHYQIAAGLRTFHNNVRENPGRLNVYQLNGARIVLDYAHNPEGLTGLIGFCRRLQPAASELHLVIGTAGDRRDDDHINLGKIAATEGDKVYLKCTTGYERGRTAAEIVGLMRAGVQSVGREQRIAGEFPSECEAVEAALGALHTGDMLAVMCLSEFDAIRSAISRRGGQEAG